MSSIDAPNSKYAVRARVDNGTEHPRKIARRAYSDQFLSGLKGQFGFDALAANMTEELQDIAFRYIVFRREENQAKYLKSSRREYLKLQKATEQFLILLKPYEERDIASDIHLAASMQHEQKNEGDLPHIDGGRKHDGRAYLRELLRLLQLLKATAKWHAELNVPRGGRPKNLGLQELIRKAAYFWITELHLRFTVDYHKGSGLSTAFEFVKALVAPLDDVTDRQIITAMRAHIATRGASGLTG